MNRFITEKEIARFLGESLPEVNRSIRNAGLKSLRKQGKTVYDRNDVLNWISANFSSLTTERLIKADEASGDSGGLDPSTCGITRLLLEGGVYFPERISTRPSVFRFLSETAVEKGCVYDASELREQLEERENVVSTALRCGVALVHPVEIARMYVEHELLLLMIPPHPVPFGEASGRLTSMFFLLLFPDPHRHVHVLARINRLLRSDDFIEALLVCSSEEEATGIVRQRELQLIGPGVPGR